MRRLALATYAINASQICNMLLTAFVVPLMIGAEQYGQYAAVFALPAFLQSGIEAYAVLNLSRGIRTRSFWLSYSGLALGATLVSALVCGYLFDPYAAVWAGALSAALMFRGAASALVYTHLSISFVRVNVTAEALTFGVYLIVLLLGLIAQASPYTIPLAMVVTASLVAGSYLLHKGMQPVGTTDQQASTERGGWRFLWARSYEDLSLTLMPLFLASSFGLSLAGEFRVIVSGMKVLSKLFPFRYEVILRGSRLGEFDIRTFAKVSAIFVLLGFGVAAVLFLMRGNIFLSEGTPIWVVALSSGALVASLAAFPVATLYSLHPMVVSTAAAVATLASVIFGVLPLFLALFIGMNFATFATSLIALMDRQRASLKPSPPNSL